MFKLVEVMKFDDDDEEEDDYEDSEPEKFVDSDMEESEKEDGIPDDRAWGNKKHMYYNTDFHDKDYGMYTEKEEEIALMEEQEALAIQKRLASELTDVDFNLEAFKIAPEHHPDEEKVKKVKTDLSGMSQKQKLQLLRQDSPEFEGLVQDFTVRMSECKDLLVPTLELFKSIDFPNHPFVEFIKCRKDLILNYCTNISFYLMLKAKRVKISNHPVVKRLVQFRELICKLDELFEYVIKPQLEVILSEANDDEPKSSKLKMLEELKSKVESKVLESDESEIEERPLFTKNTESDSEDDDEEEEETKDIENIEELGTKRQITRQIAKNKGLTATKRRELRNPRVKNRLKFTKAVKKRKGAVQPIRSKKDLYGGEVTGIKTHLKRSVKIK